MKKNILISFIGVLFCCFGSCKKMLVVDEPIESKTYDQVFSSTSTATIAMTSVFSYLANNYQLSGYGSISTWGSILSDELVAFDPWDGNAMRVYKNDVLIEGATRELWSRSYKYIIYPCNSIIEGVAQSAGIQDEAKSILIGEAKFIRALAYFYLVNFYGDVPLVTTTNWQTNSAIPRANKELVYDQIVEDLLNAQILLSEKYINANLSAGSSERIRPNKMAATALLSRVYLFRNEWSLAEQESSKVITAPAYKLTDLNSIFLRNSPEAIWQLQPSPTRDNANRKNTFDADYYIPIGSAAPYASPRVHLSDHLIDEFEADDQRRTSWVKSFTTLGGAYNIPFKYKIGNQTGDNSIQEEYCMVLRLSEQYLIRAEARAHLNKLTGSNSAQADIDMVRERAGLNGTTAISQPDLLTAIDHERYVELFTEMGHRWLDLKRRNKIDERMNVITPLKGGSWAAFKALLPIPYDEIKYNPLLVGKQNPGYPEF